MNEPFLKELSSMQPGNELYARWLEYALTLTKSDIHIIVRNGLTYQAESLKSMIKEIIGGGVVPPTLLKKLDLIVLATKKYADNIR